MPDDDKSDERARRSREASRRWKEANPERVREQNRRWREQNLERARQLNRESMRRTATRSAAAKRRSVRAREYYDAHAEKLRAYSRDYHARRRAEDPEGYAEARRAWNRAWYERNKERLTARQAERYRDDPAKWRDAARDYYQRHREQIRAKNRAYYERNKEGAAERQRAWNAKQRQRKAAGLPPRNLHRTPLDQRRANRKAADLFFARNLADDDERRLRAELGTPRELLAAWGRDCKRARAEHYAATNADIFTHAATAQELEDARLDEIGRRVSAYLQHRAPHLPTPSPSNGVPFTPPTTPHQGMSR